MSFYPQPYSEEQVASILRKNSYMPADHMQSRRVAEKLGMVLEKQCLNARNRGYLTCVYAISRDARVSE